MLPQQHLARGEELAGRAPALEHLGQGQLITGTVPVGMCVAHQSQQLGFDSRHPAKYCT